MDRRNVPALALDVGQARVTAGKIFGEMAIGFSRFYFNVDEELELIAELEGNPLPIEIRGQ